MVVIFLGPLQRLTVVMINLLSTADPVVKIEMEMKNYKD